MKRFFILCVVLACALAVKVTWKQGPLCHTNANFNTVACWDTQKIPSEKDDVTIDFPAGSKGEVVMNTNVTVKSITVSGTAILRIQTAITAKQIDITNGAGICFEEKVKKAHISNLNVHKGLLLLNSWLGTDVNTLNVEDSKIELLNTTESWLNSTESTLSKVQFLSSASHPVLRWASNKCHVTGDLDLLPPKFTLEFRGRINRTTTTNVYLETNIDIKGDAGATVSFAELSSVHVKANIAVSTNLVMSDANVIYNRVNSFKPTISAKMVTIRSNNITVNLVEVNSNSISDPWAILTGDIKIVDLKTSNLTVNIDKSKSACTSKPLINRKPEGRLDKDVLSGIKQLYVYIPAFEAKLTAPVLNVTSVNASTIKVEYNKIQLSESNRNCIQVTQTKYRLTVDGRTPMHMGQKNSTMLSESVMINNVTAGRHVYGLRTEIVDVFGNVMNVTSYNVSFPAKEVTKTRRDASTSSKVGGFVAVILVVMAFF